MKGTMMDKPNIIKRDLMRLVIFMFLIVFIITLPLSWLYSVIIIKRRPLKLHFQVIEDAWEMFWRDDK